MPSTFVKVHYRQEWRRPLPNITGMKNIKITTNILLLTALANLAALPAAHAAHVTVTGEATVKYERDRADGEPAVSGTMTTVKLTAEGEMSSGWSWYARLAAQQATQPALADFNTGAYASGTKSVAALDQFGFVHKAGPFTYKLGRQDVTIGTEALLYKRNHENVGRHAFVDGLTVGGKSGATDLSLVAAREDNEAGRENGTLYALRAGWQTADKTSWGLTWGRYQNSTAGSTTHWAVDGKYEFGKHSLSAQYTQSDAASDNKGYVMNWTYDFDGKTALYLMGFRRESAAAMGDQSEFDGGHKGFYYGLTHSLGKNTGLEILYKDQRQLGDGAKNNKFEAIVTHSF